MRTPDKSHVLDAFAQSLKARLEATAAITAQARDEATSEETRPENKYDTRALEASYLAAGQGERLAALRALVTWLAHTVPRPATHAGLGSLVEVADETSQSRWLLVAPQGGERANVDGLTIELLGIRSPLGKALQGLEADDSVEVATPRGVRTWEVISIL